jgi:hypothetical protein
VPQVRDLGELNDHLRRCCQEACERPCGGNDAPVGERFAADRRAALPAPARRFDACVIQPAQVDKYQTVRFDGNSYSVPRRFAFRAVTVKGYVDRVAVVADAQEVAAHARRYGRGEKVLDPLHFLVVLAHKPAALDHAPVYRDWHLPAAFAELRQHLEARLGPRTGARHYIRVLQLLAAHPLSRVEQAILRCRARGRADAAAVTAAVERSACDSPVSPAGPMAAGPAPLPDLTRFDLLLARSHPGDRSDESDHLAAAEGQLEAAQTADHAGRARETGPGGGRA